MKKALFTLVVLFLLCPRVFSLELELKGGLGNLSFDHGRKTSLGAAVQAFDHQLFPLALARLSGTSGGIAWNGGFEYDSLTRSRVFGNVRFELDNFFVEAGPFLSLFNTKQLPVNPGISAALGFQIPGIVFARAGGTSTLAIIDMDEKGSHRQYGADISVGFWVPYVICSLNMSYRSFAARDGAPLLIEDERTRYFFSADVYTKNVPYNVRVDLGYQNLGRSYSDTGLKDEYKAFFVGFEGSYILNPALKFLLAGEMPVYSWAARPMKDPPDNFMLFEATVGVVWTLPVSSASK